MHGCRHSRRRLIASMLMVISLGACGTLTPSTADTFCLAYEPVFFTAPGWVVIEQAEPRAYGAIMRNNAKHFGCPK